MVCSLPYRADCLSVTPECLGSITFGLPLLAWGLLALGIPVLVHLVLRERARQEIFPALRFLVTSHTSANRAQWVRHLLLLGARLALIALAVGILGRVGCMREGGAPTAVLAPATPASVVLCIDNSASMGYRYQGRTRVQAATDWARNLMEDGRQFGPGSQFSIVCGSRLPGMGVWREDIRATGRQLDTIRPAEHNLGVGQLLSRAYHLISAARHPRREIYVFSDLTESSWSDSPPPAPESLTGVYFMDVGQEENRNTMLGWPQVAPHELAAGLPSTVPIHVATGELACEPVLTFSVDGRARGRQTTGPMAAGSHAETALTLPGLERGAHLLKVELESEDAMSFDNVRYAWLVAGELPRVALVSDEPDGEVGRMVQAMIAPPALAAGDQQYIVRPVALDQLLTLDTAGLTAAILADVKSLNGLAWDKLSGYVRGGGTLIIVPGPNLTPEGYQPGQSILPATIESAAVCDPPLRPAASNLSHAYLAPFSDVTIDSVNDRHAFKRLVLKGLSPQASVVFPFSDGSPALIDGRAGNGRTILFAFSPAADWGQFGTQAAPTIVLLHRILETIRPALDSLAIFTAGRPGLRSVGDGSSPLLVGVGDGRETTVVPSAAKLYAFPTDTAGGWSAAEKSNPQTALFHYSVNVAESESHRQRVTGEAVKSRFDKVVVAVQRPGEELRPQAGGGPVRVAWSAPLGLVLLLLLLIESSFGNRFYRFGRG